MSEWEEDQMAKDRDYDASSVLHKVGSFLLALVAAAVGLSIVCGVGFLLLGLLFGWLT